jgi:hypothetical protein
VNLSSKGRRLVRIAALAASIIAVVCGFHLYSRTGADRVQHLVSWPGGCESITRDTPGPQNVVHAWTKAQERVVIRCHDAGPIVLYARFANVADRNAALRQTPPPGRYCLSDREVVLDGLDNGFSALCRELHGRLGGHPKARSAA